VERLIDVLWTKFIAKNAENSASRTLSPPTSGKRADKLKANTMTASIRIEILAITNELTEQEYTHIEKARKARNNWIHSLTPIAHEDAISSAFVAALLIKRLYGIRLQTEYEAWGSWSA
jgi:hypothetical protein